MLYFLKFMGVVMDIVEEIQKIEALIEIYEESNEPEERMDMKQTIGSSIAAVKKESRSLPEDLQKQVQAQLADFEEILTY